MLQASEEDADVAGAGELLVDEVNDFLCCWCFSSFKTGQRSFLPVCLPVLGRSCPRSKFGEQWGNRSMCGQWLVAENIRWTYVVCWLLPAAYSRYLPSFVCMRNYNKLGIQAHYWRDWVKQTEFKIKNVHKAVYIKPFLGFEFTVFTNYIRKTISTSQPQWVNSTIKTMNKNN